MSRCDLSLFPYFAQTHSPFLSHLKRLNKRKLRGGLGGEPKAPIEPLMWNDSRQKKKPRLTRRHSRVAAMKNNTALNDKRLHSGASSFSAPLPRATVCLRDAPEAGRCQTSLKLWNAGLFAETRASFRRCSSQSH